MGSSSSIPKQPSSKAAPTQNEKKEAHHSTADIHNVNYIHGDSLSEKKNTLRFVVIIYSRNDRDIAVRLVERMRQLNLTVKSISHHASDVRNPIGASLTLAILSSSFFKTSICRQGLESSLKNGIPWIPLKVELGFSISSVHYSWLQTGLQQTNVFSFVVKRHTSGINEEAFESRFKALSHFLLRFPTDHPILELFPDSNLDDQAVSLYVTSHDENLCKAGLLHVIDSCIRHFAAQLDHVSLENKQINALMNAVLGIFAEHSSTIPLVTLAAYAMVALLQAYQSTFTNETLQSIAQACNSYIHVFNENTDIILELLIALHSLCENKKTEARHQFKISHLPQELQSSLLTRTSEICTKFVDNELIITQGLTNLHLFEKTFGKSNPETLTQLGKLINNTYGPTSIPRQLFLGINESR